MSNNTKKPLNPIIKSVTVQPSDTKRMVDRAQLQNLITLPMALSVLSGTYDLVDLSTLPPNAGATQFNSEWQPTLVYSYDPIQSPWAHMVTYNTGLYVLTARPNGNPPGIDSAWTLIASTGNANLGRFKGFYDAATNTPTLVNGVGEAGDYYITKVPGSNTPSGEYANINDTVACNDLLQWEVGGTVSNTDSIIVSNNYIVIPNQVVQIGQTVTTALGVLQGQINTFNQSLSGKQDLVFGAIPNNLAALDIDGQTFDSGVAISAIGTVKSVTSANNDIGITQSTTNPILTLNSSVNGVANKIAKYDANGALGTVDIGTNGQVNAGAGFTGSLNTVLIALKQLIPAPYTLPAATTTSLGGSIYPPEGALVVDSSGQVSVNVDNKTIRISGSNQLQAILPPPYSLPPATTTTLGGSIYPDTGSALAVDGLGQVTVGVDGKTITINGDNKLVAVLPPPYTLPAATQTTLGGSVYPLEGALIVDGLGQVAINVDGVTTKIVNNQLVAFAAASGITAITTPDGKTNTVPTINFLNGTNMTILSDGSGNITFNASGGGGAVTFSNTLIVAKNGNDTTGNGSLSTPYLTIAKALSVATAGTQIIIYGGTYTENITLVAGTAITGAQSQTVVLAGTVTTAATGGTFYIENLRIQPTSAIGNVSLFNIVGGANFTNVQVSNCDINLWGGTGSCINWTNTNANSKFAVDGIAAFNVINSTSGAKIFTSSTTAAGNVTLTWVSSQINDNTNNVAYSINGAIKFYHTFDNIYGQVQVANTAGFFGTFLTMNTGNVAALVTNSSSYSTLNSIIMTTTANATAGTAVVEGAGLFAFNQTSTPNTTVKGFATTLNGGIGAIAGPTYAIRLDSSGIAPFVAGTSDGLLQYDGSYFYADNSSVRNKLVTADNTTNKILPAWLSNQEIRTAVSYTLTAAQLPLNGFTTITNTSTTASINITLPVNYNFTSTGYGNTVSVFTLPKSSSVTLECTLVAATSLVAINGIVTAGFSLTYNNTPVYNATSNNDAVTSQGLFYALANAAGSGLTYSNGQLNVGSVASATYASADGFLQGTVLGVTKGLLGAVSGQLNFGTAQSETSKGCIINGTTITLATSRNYQINLSVPVQCPSTPIVNLFNLDYVGTTDNPPTFGLTATNFDSTNGTFANGIFTASSNNASLTSKGYTANGYIMQYTPRASFWANCCIINTAVGSNLTFFSQAAPQTNFILKNSSGAVAPATLSQTSLVGTGMVAAPSWQNYATPDGTKNNMTACSTKWTVVTTGGGFTTVVAISQDQGNTFQNSATFASISVTRPNQMVVGGNYCVITTGSGTPSASATMINLGTGGVVTEATLPLRFLTQVNFGLLNGGNTFVVVNRDITNSTGLQIYTAPVLGTWSNRVNNLGDLYDATKFYISGIAQEATTGVWYVTIIDTVNSATYVCKSSDLVTFTQVATFNAMYFTLVGGLLAGTGPNNSVLAAQGGSSNSVGFTNTIISMVNGNDVWATMNNPLQITNSGYTLVYHPCGMLVNSATSTANKFTYCLDGQNWNQANLSGNFTYTVLPMGYWLVEKAFVDNQFKCAAAYYATYSGLPYIPTYVWQGGQTLQAGYPPVDDTPNQYYLNADYSIDVVGTTVYVSGTSTNVNYKVGLRALNAREMCREVSSNMFVLGNSIRLTATGNNVTISSVPQYALNQYDRIQLSAIVSTNTNTPTVSVNYDFAASGLTILPGASIVISEV